MRLRRSQPQRGSSPRIALAIALLAWTAVPVFGQDAWTSVLSSRASTARTKGSESAPIFVYEFANFQCPHCAKFALDVFPRIDSVFVQSGKVRWIFVHLPGPSHANAWAAHEAAACAGAVGDRFWPMHDRLFATQTEWSGSINPRKRFAKMARELGIAAEAFDQCMDEDRVASILLQDVIFAASSRVNGTPAYMVNNQTSVMGLKSYDEWRDILEKAIKKAR
jgi:protein-disulfide isomerase